MSGKHRKLNPLALTLRATGTLAGAAIIIGTAAGTASAAIPIPGKDAPATGAIAAAGAALAGKHAAQPQNPQADTGGGGENGEQQGKDAEEPKNDEGDEKDKKDKRPTAQDAIDKARGEVGTRENSSGEVKFQKWYMDQPRAKETVKRDGGAVKAYNGAAWCSMFISWIGDEIGMSDQFGSDAWTVKHAQWFKDEDRWGTKPKPGAIAFFNWKGQKSISSIVHVGMVVKDAGNGKVKTIEGNTGNAVKERTRSSGQIVGYGYPDYAK